MILPNLHTPLLIVGTLSSKSSKESTLKTLLGLEAISFSSEVSTSSPIPNTNTAAPLLWRREEAISRGRYTPWSAVCFPVVITNTGCGQTIEKHKVNLLIHQVPSEVLVKLRGYSSFSNLPLRCLSVHQRVSAPPCLQDPMPCRFV